MSQTETNETTRVEPGNGLADSLGATRAELFADLADSLGALREAILHVHRESASSEEAMARLQTAFGIEPNTGAQ